MPHKFNSKPIIAIVAALIVIAGIVFLAKKQNPIPAPVTEETSGSAAPALAGVLGTSAGTSQTGAVQYQDGTYTATGDYVSPGGPQTVQVSLTLKDGIVVDSSVVAGATDRTSSRYQSMFIAGYAQYVNGKNIDDINVARVSGSSLTAKGFNDAVSKIKSAAIVS